MKKMYKKVFIFLFPVLLVWGVVEFFYRTTQTNYTLKFEQITNAYKDSEVLIFGNSHALYGLDPAYFEKKSFNIANVSQSLYFDELLFNRHIDSLKNLRAIVLTVSYFSLSQEDNTSEDLWRKYFYQHQMQMEVPIISNYDIKKYSMALARRFQKSVEMMREYLKFGTNIDCFNNGYGKQDETDIVPDKETITPIIVKKHEDGLQDFTTNNRRLQRIIDACMQRGIEVFLVEMPVYKTYYESLMPEKRDKIVVTLKQLERDNLNVVYVKLSQHSAFLPSDLRDADHLTNEGAIKCSKLLSGIIEEKLKSN